MVGMGGGGGPEMKLKYSDTMSSMRYFTVQSNLPFSLPSQDTMCGLLRIQAESGIRVHHLISLQHVTFQNHVW